MKTATKTVRITSYVTGQHFGHVGEIRAMNHRVIDRTDFVYPTPAAAKAAARRRAEKAGYTVAN